MTRPYQPLDFLALDDLLSEDERMVRDTVRTFVGDRVLPIIEKHFRAGTFPRDLVPAMAAMGLLGSNLHGYGCAGLNNVAYGLIMQELERGDSGLRSFVSVQGALCMYPIFAFGSPEQKERWLPALARGEAVGCFGLTEPDAGSDPARMRTRAVRKGDGYVLNGAEAWVSARGGGVGSAQAVFEEALGHARERVVFGKPIAAFQIQQEKLVWMASEITKGQLLALRLGRLKDEGKVTPAQVSLGKRNNVWVASECARLAREILGANGITDEFQAGRHLCNIESVYTYEGTHDIHTLILGEALTGHSAFS